MSLQVEKLEHNMAKLTIEVDEQEVEKALQAAYVKMKGRITLPGFRKGKVPRQMIEKMYGPEIFYDEAANGLINSSYPAAYDESDLSIVSQPEIDVVQLEKGKPFIYTALVALKPDVTLGDYKGLKVEKSDVSVSAEEVEAEIEKERERNGRTIEVTDRAVADKDMIKLDFEGFVDGVAFDGGKGEDYPLTIGSGSFIPGFEEQLVGANIGEDVEVNVTFPEDYQAKELAGKAAVFKCKVNAISAKELPELDDEFASEVSEFETLAEYRSDVEKKLKERKETTAKEKKENEVVEKAIENASMDIPDAMLNQQTKQLVDDFTNRITQQGLTVEQYYQFTGMSAEKMNEEMKGQALRRIKTRLVLEAIAKAENIQVSDERLHEELEKMAKAYNMEADKLAELISDAEREQMKEDIAVQEAVTLIAEAAVEE